MKGKCQRRALAIFQRTGLRCAFPENLRQPRHLLHRRPEALRQHGVHGVSAPVRCQQPVIRRGFQRGQQLILRAEVAQEGQRVPHRDCPRRKRGENRQHLPFAVGQRVGGHHLGDSLRNRAEFAARQPQSLRADAVKLFQQLRHRPALHLRQMRQQDNRQRMPRHARKHLMQRFRFRAAHVFQVRVVLDKQRPARFLRQQRHSDIPEALAQREARRHQHIAAPMLYFAQPLVRFRRHIDTVNQQQRPPLIGRFQLLAPC